MVRIELKEIVSNYDNKRKALNAVERGNKKTNPQYPYYGANGIVDFIDEYIFDEELLCIAEDGGNWGYKQNCSYIVNGKYWVNNHVHVLKPKKNVEIKYLMYYLNYTDLTSYITGTTRGKLTRTALDKIQINLPELEIQREIVIILDKINNLMEKNKKRIIYLEELVKSRFIEMFGDPIKNDKGWGVKKLNEIYEIIDGDRGKNYPKSVDYLKEGFCLFLNAKNVTKNGFRFEDTNYISKEKDKNMGKGKLKRGDIVLTTRGTLGNLAIYSNEIKYSHIRINSGMVILRKIYDNIEKRYFIEYLKNSKIIEKIKSGTAQPQIPILHLKKIKIPVPSMALQTQFSTKIEKLEKLKFEAEKSLKEMENLYESLMQKFFKQN